MSYRYQSHELSHEQRRGTKIANLLPTECLIALTALVSLVAIYAIVLFIKDRYSQPAGGQAKRNNLCQACKESNTNCKIVQNKLTNSRGVNEGRTGSYQICERCKVQLTGDKGNTNNIRQQANYGKETVDIYRAQGHSSSSSSRSGAQQEFNGDNTTVFKLCGGTGQAFDPNDASLVSASQPNTSHEQLACQMSLASDTNCSSFQTVLEIEPQLAAVSPNSNANELHLADFVDPGETGEQMKPSGAGDRWRRGVRRARQVRSVLAELFERASKHVALGRDMANGLRKFNDADGDTSEVTLSEQRAAELEEPEFLESRKLRSAQIQM